MCHMKNEHGEMVANLRWQEQVEYVLGRKLRWECRHERNTCYKRIANCPYCNCGYIGMIPEALQSHMSQVHQELLELANDLGILFATVVMHARNFQEIPSAEKMLRPARGSMCTRCDWFVGKDRLSVCQHARKAHPRTEVEGTRTEACRVELRPIWLHPERDRERIAQADQGLREDNERRATLRAALEVAAAAPVNNVPRTGAMEEAARSRREREEALRARRERETPENERRHPDPSDTSSDQEQGQDRIERAGTSQEQETTNEGHLEAEERATGHQEGNEERGNNRTEEGVRETDEEVDDVDELLTNDRTRRERREIRRRQRQGRQERARQRQVNPDSEPTEEPSGSEREEQTDGEPHRRRQPQPRRTPAQMLELARTWTEEGKREEEESVNLPKIWGAKRRKLHNRLNNVMRTKIQKLIEDCQREDLETEEEWYIWEGMMWRVKTILRKEIRRALKIPIDHQRGQFRARDRAGEDERRTLERYRSMGKLISTIQRIRAVQTMAGGQRNQNIVARLKDKAFSLLQQIPDELLEIIGRRDARTIDELVDERQERLDYIRAELIRKEAEMGGRSLTADIRERYKEDPSKTLRWFVLDDKSPECEIPMETFEETYGAKWEEEPPFQWQEIWGLTRHGGEEDVGNIGHTLRNLLLDEEMIKKTLSSRSNMSAHGVDGLGNAVWKANTEVAVRLIRHTIELMWKHKSFPESMKDAKTIFLYKGGDKEEAKSWRPITIMTTLYRAMTAHMAHCLQVLNMSHRFISPQQKGFMMTPAGAIEHITLVNEMISDASRNHKSLYLVSLDLRDAFGSVPHELIMRNMEGLGIPEEFIDAIRDMYDGCKTKMTTSQGTSRPFLLNRGVKQGCPLSPTLFNCCIEPLLRRLNQRAARDGYHVAGDAIAVLAYADDVLLLSDTEEGMNNLLRLTEEFCEYAQLTVNAQKCRSLTYIVQQRSRSTISTEFRVRGEAIPAVSLEGTFEYLGAAIGVVGTRRMRTRLRLLEKIEEDVTLIASSPLKDNQVVDAVRRFILPRAEYSLMSGICPKESIKDLDTKIRGILGRRIRTAGIPKDFFYANWRDGGLSLPKMTERQAELTLNTFVRLYDSSEELTRKIFRHCVTDERIKRGLNRDESSELLQIELDENGEIPQSRGTNSILIRAIKAMESLDVRLYRREHSFYVKTRSEEGWEETKIAGRHLNLLPTLNEMLRKKHIRRLQEHPMKGHSFKTLANRPLSNFFIDWRSKVSSDTIRFAWRARTNTLMTGEVERRRGTGEGRCSSCRQLDSLMHRLNGCPSRRFAYKPRHDAIVNVLCDEINKQGGSRNRRTFHWDSTVEGPNGERLQDQHLARLKPDLWFYDETGLKIVEVTVPYGSATMLNGRETDTLQVRRDEKIRKYTALAEAARAQFGVNVGLYVIVVSSLGAIPEATMRDLRHLVLAHANGTAKKMVFAAIKGSRDIYLNRMSQQIRRQERVPTGDPEIEEMNNQDRAPPSEDDMEERSDDSQSLESSDETLDEADSDLLEDPTRPWWDTENGEPRPEEEEGNEEIARAVDALFGTEVRPEPAERAHDQGGEPTREATHTGTGSVEGPDQEDRRRRRGSSGGPLTLTADVETAQQD